ncbi:MAG: cytochrome b5-like heme/steroid binding domain-containing protein [Candidatus Peribacteraceae bacterium]|jgi:cytochrome b involved in lipid metabolism
MNKTALLSLGSVLMLLALTGCSKPANPTVSAGSSSSASLPVLTMEDVAKHASAQDCYTVVGDNVYDVSAFTSKHPGGPDKIIALCGKDGTDPFTRKHGTFQKAIDTLATLRIGTLAK